MKNNKEKKDQTLQFKCSLSEKARILAQMARENFTDFSDYARKVLLDREGRIRPNGKPLKAKAAKLADVVYPKQQP